MTYWDDHPPASGAGEGADHVAAPGSAAPGSDERPVPRPMALPTQLAVRQEHPERLQSRERVW